MQRFVIIIAMLFAAPAFAGTVTIQPGQCILIGSTNVCAASTPVVSQPYYPHQPQTVVVEPVQEVTPYAYCSLSENRSPNVWQLFRQGGNSKHRMNQFVKSFPHFEGSKCQAEADRINERS